MSVETVLSSLFADKLMNQHKLYAGTNNLFFEKTFYCFTDELKSVGLDISECLNKCHHVWYYGNFAHGILVHVLHPYFDRETPYHLSRVQIREAIRLLYKVILEYKIDLDAIDYYGYTCKKYVTNCTDISKLGLTHLRKEELNLLYRVVCGAKHMHIMQQTMIKKFVERIRIGKKRKEAAQVIADYLQELVLSPYTYIGKKMLHKRACKFYELSS